jgi:TonB family protein
MFLIRRLILAGLGAVFTLGWTSPVCSAPSSVSTPALTLELIPNTNGGLLDPGHPFDCLVRVKGLKPRQGEELVVIFESLTYPDRLAVLASNEDLTDLTASVRFEPRLDFLGEPGVPVRLDVVVARLRGMRLETLFSRPVYLTTGPAPVPTRQPIVTTLPGTALLEAIVREAPSTNRFGHPMEAALPGETIHEEVSGDAPEVAGPLYWKRVRELVARFWQTERAQLRKDQAARGLRVRFRLYRTGFAQAIQVERSSGDPAVDEAGLRTILRLHPFPPFPPDIQEPFVDVHVELPSPHR